MHHWLRGMDWPAYPTRSVIIQLQAWLRVTALGNQIYTHMHTRTPTNIHSLMRTHTHLCTQTHTYAHTHTYTQICTHTCMHTYAHTPMHTLTHTHTHTHTYIYIYIYSYIYTLSVWPCPTLYHNNCVSLPFVTWSCITLHISWIILRCTSLRT